MTPDDIKEVMILRVQPGDAIIVKVDRPVSRMDADRIKADWERTFRDTAIRDTPLVLLDAGGELSILRRDDTDGPTTRADAARSE